MFVMRSPSVFGSAEWLTVPYSLKTKSNLDTIIDVITLSSGLLYRIDRLKETEKGEDAYYEENQIRAEAEALKTQLDGLWEVVRESAGHHGWEGEYFNGIPGFDNINSTPAYGRSVELTNDKLSSVYPVPWKQSESRAGSREPNRRFVEIEETQLASGQARALPLNSKASGRGLDTSMFPNNIKGTNNELRDFSVPTLPHELNKVALVHADDFSTRYPSLSTQFKLPLPPRQLPGLPDRGITSRPVVFYNAARMSILSVLDQVGARPTLFQEQMEAHSGSIFSVARYMTGVQVGYAYLRLVMPIHVAGMLSPRLEQRLEARRLLQLWSKFEGVQGVCEVALRELGDAGG
jgi:hypothetical protein